MAYNPLDIDILSVPGQSYNEKIIYLSKCKCCIRHQHSKPTIYSFWDDDDDNINTNNLNSDRSCNCKCRHISRFICRLYYEQSRPPSPINIYNV